MIKNHLAIIHVAKKQLGLDDTAYRAILSGIGVTSSKDIKTNAQFNTVMSAFEQLGFRSTSWIGTRQTVSGVPGRITKPQEYYIKGLWALASRVKDEKSLRRMIKRIGKVDDISFLSRWSASAIILALRDICWKAGFNPDNKEDSDVCNGKGSGAHTANGTSPGVLPPLYGGNGSDTNRQSLAADTGSGD
jgi:hypothetical protein